MSTDRTFIDFGIDLGTTNSAVAVWTGGRAEVVRNNEHGEITPSVVWIDRKGGTRVGRAARERIEQDEPNTASEFKLRMGTAGQASHFPASGRSLEPEELSAEVLKSLRGDVSQRLGEEIDQAVITVPAAFGLEKTAATRRAAEMAGLGHTPLLSEPSAAAYAYGFQAEADNRFWLVYDLGGGTFDAAVLHLRDGECTILNNEGDNSLGGKNIDWAIVEQLLVPAVTRQAEEHGRTLTGFARGDKRWTNALNQLKTQAERAKIDLSRQDSVDIIVQHLADDDGRPFDFEFELSRTAVEALALPFYRRSIACCRRALDKVNLTPDAIERVLLVGGPTLAPHLRATVRAELGIELDISQDPLTVVARGAALFAASQPRSGATTPPPEPGRYVIELDYQRIDADESPFVGGRVSGHTGALPDGLTIEFDNRGAQPPWRSAKIPVDPDGVFTTTLVAERGRENLYDIVLTDGAGRRLTATPATLTYTIGLPPIEARTTDAFGIGLANNEMMTLVDKGTPLPSTREVKLVTITAVRRGDPSAAIRIPVLEGQQARADRNWSPGQLEIPGDHPKVIRDVPAGSDVEFTLTIDESRLLAVTAFIPLLGEEFHEQIELERQGVPEQPELQAAARSVQDRLHAVEHLVHTNDDLAPRARLEQIADEQLVEELDTELRASATDRDAAVTCMKRAKNIEAALDEVEALLRWPELVREAERLLEDVRQLVHAQGTADDARSFAKRERETRRAVEVGDPHFLEQHLNSLRRLGSDVLHRDPRFQVEMFEHLRSQQAEMTDQHRAQRLIDHGNKAIAAGELPVLQSINQQLTVLLWRDESDAHGPNVMPA